MVEEVLEEGLTSEYKPVIIVGGGPAGLSLSCYLKRRGIQHLILEKGQVGESWRSQRWDSLHIAGPNWLFQLPDAPYWRDRDGYMHSKEVVKYLKHFAQDQQSPVHSGVRVHTISASRNGIGFDIETTNGNYRAAQVVAATGFFHTPAIPAFSSSLPDDICQLPASSYRNPEKLPPGAVVVVGCGLSGCQIADDLRRSGRTVYLTIGRSRWLPRYYRGKDFAWWLHHMDAFNEALKTFRQNKSEEDATLQSTGSNSQHDVNLHTLARDGVILLGRLEGIQNGKLCLADNVHEQLVEADAQSMETKAKIDEYIDKNQIDAAADDWPEYTEAYAALPPEPVVELNLTESDVSTVVWATGYQRDLSYVQLPVFDETGTIIHDRWVTPYHGFYFFSFPLLIASCSDEADHLASVIETRISEAASTPRRK